MRKAINSIAVNTSSNTAFTGVTGGFNGLAVGNDVNVGVTGTTAAAAALQNCSLVQ